MSVHNTQCYKVELRPLKQSHKKTSAVGLLLHWEPAYTENVLKAPSQAAQYFSAIIPEMLEVHDFQVTESSPASRRLLGK